MQIPKSIKVGGITYQVKESERLSLGENYNAEIDYQKAVIEIQKSLEKQVAQRSFLHEVIHAIYSELGYSEHDEKQIDELAGAFFQLIVDNPAMFK